MSATQVRLNGFDGLGRAPPHLAPAMTCRMCCLIELVAARSTDRLDLIHPGIIQCELCVGCLYVFPHQLQHVCYPFEGDHAYDAQGKHMLQSLSMVGINVWRARQAQSCCGRRRLMLRD